ncbi:MAG: hypothetical protein NWF10_03350 [Candidatus Bathyarchaeota archaeon]|nr:hypothetical protein [Candidatus Bathyarchaeota archaeon]
MKCADCKEEILSTNIELCPYCHSKKLVPSEEIKEHIPTKIEEAANLVKAGRYEEAAILYEELEMWKKACKCRKLDRQSYIAPRNLNVGKVASIIMTCPYCNASQSVVSKSKKVVCSSCKKKYVIPRKVLDLI